MTPADFHFDPDLAHAATLPAAWYTDPDMLKLEHERVFRRTWQYAASLDRLQLPGNFLAVDVVGVPVVLTHDLDGEIRAFYNVCRHRAGVVARGAGNRRTLQCQYHGWCYGLDGRLKSTPEFDGVADFNRDDFGLVPIRAEIWGGFVFVNMSGDAPQLLDYLGQIPVETAALGLDGMRRLERRDYYLNANWKLYVDNYLEGYHIPIAHPGLFRELDYNRYRVDTFRYYSSQYAPIRPVRAEDGAGRVYTELRGDEKAYYYWLFPNFMINMYLGILQINIIVPIAYDRTLTIFEWYFADPGTAETWNRLQDSIDFSDEIQQEDIELCEDVWRNLQTGAYDQGRFSVQRENGVHHFHGLLAEFLG